MNLNGTLYKLHWKSFPHKRTGVERWHILYKVAFFLECSVQKRSTFFFWPQFIIDSEGSYVKAEKLSGKENETFRQVWAAGEPPLLVHLPSLKHTKHTTLKKSAHRQFFIQKWPFRTCHPLTAWFPAPEGKEVKKKEKTKKTKKTLISLSASSYTCHVVLCVPGNLINV